MHGLGEQSNDYTVVIFETVVCPTGELNDCSVFVLRVTYICPFRNDFILFKETKFQFLYCNLVVPKSSAGIVK